MQFPAHPCAFRDSSTRIVHVGPGPSALKVSIHLFIKACSMITTGRETLGGCGKFCGQRRLQHQPHSLLPSCEHCPGSAPGAGCPSRNTACPCTWGLPPKIGTGSKQAAHKATTGELVLRGAGEVPGRTMAVAVAARAPLPAIVQPDGAGCSRLSSHQPGPGSHRGFHINTAEPRATATTTLSPTREPGTGAGSWNASQGMPMPRAQGDTGIWSAPGRAR